MSHFRIQICLRVLFLLTTFSFAYAQDQAIPELTAHVNDLTGTLSAAEKSSIENDLIAYETEKGSQIVVLIVSSTQPETIEEYSMRVAEAWKIGRQGVDDGIILLVAKDDRKLRLEVGYGLEGAIPDAYSKRIIENIILPDFRQGDFYGGIKEGTAAIKGLIDGEDLPAVTGTNDQALSMNNESYFMLFIVLGIGVLTIIKAFVKKSKYKWLTVGIVSVLMGLIFGLLFAGIGFAISSILLFSTATTGGGGRYYGGGFSGGGSSFGGGGFSGGGGSFGGGGASGGW